MDRQLRARVVVSEARAMGLSVQDLVAAAAGAPASSSDVPTVSEYLRRIEPTFSPGTRRTYRSYWRLAERHFGDRRVDAVTVDDCEAVVLAAAERARAKRPGSDARSPRENCVAALRALFERARRAKYVLESPAAEVGKPRRLTSRRRGLDDQELVEVVEAVRTTTRDLELDLLLVRFHLVTGARQEGALNLVLDGIDDRRSTVWLREKYGKEREQPVPPSLLPSLRAHARRRGATRGEDKVFRTRRNVPASRRHYDTLFRHVQDALPWSIRTPVTAHVLRHTAASAVERLAGLAVAEKFLGHEPNSVTATYTEARLDEVAAAVAEITGEPHPLASRSWTPTHAA
jgi:integrase